MAAPNQLTTEGLLIAYYSNIKRQRELRAEMRQLEEELERRYNLTQDQFRRGDIELIGGEPVGNTIIES